MPKRALVVHWFGRPIPIISNVIANFEDININETMSLVDMNKTLGGKHYGGSSFLTFLL